MLINEPPYPVIADESGEVGSLEVVEDVYELSAVDGVAGGEAAPREDAQLQELGDCLILGRPCRQAVTMSCVF